MVGGSSVLHRTGGRGGTEQILVAPGLPQLLVEPSFRVVQSTHGGAEHEIAAIALSFSPALEGGERRLFR